MKKVTRIMVMIVTLLVTIGGVIKANATAGDPFTESVKVRCTCYLDGGTTASGKQTRPGIMAAKSEWIGCVACINRVNEDGTIGEFIGYYEILDTGYGRETGIGESKILNGRTLGTIETGDTVDIWMPDIESANEWIALYGDYVYIKIIDGKG